MMHARAAGLVLGFCLTLSATPALAQAPAGQCDAWAATPEAWQEVESVIRRNYAYLDRVEDAAALFAQARQSAAGVSSVAELGSIAETLGYAFRDGHFHVSPVEQPERAWIPSSSDFWVEKVGQRWIVADVNLRSHARREGVRPGWELVSMGGYPIGDLARAALSPVTEQPEADQIEYAANVILTGWLGQSRSFVFTNDQGKRTVELPAAQQSFADRPDGLMQIVSHEGIVHIRIKNSLGENALIPAFDEAMEALGNADALILDLRDTPGGGNTKVARAILGHFVSEPTVYQVHRNMFEEVNFGVRRQYAEYVFPRGERFTKPVVVLAGRWTGSVGEALAMAFDTAAGVHTIGSPLGDLLGTLNRNRLDNGCMSLSFAWDKLFSRDGLPREDWVPQEELAAGDTDPDGNDPALARALAYLAWKISGSS